MGVTSPTPAQTVGPFFEIGLRWLDPPELVGPAHPGAVRVAGQVFDGHGEPVPDAVIEIFQADPGGRFPPETAEGWTGFARCLSDDEGRYEFVTVKPGPVEEGAAPHLDVSVFARGLLQRLVTRCYFADEPTTATDRLLAAVGEAAASLVAERQGDAYRFDVHLQGDRETAFFAW
ncbi:MAG: protocatechuate 3,4-dioxygenase subunit alpha [Acidimicrobiales bacterium]